MAGEALPDRQRWDAAIAGDPATISSLPTPLLRRDAPIAVIGGALAAALIPVLADAGFQPVAAERRHPILADLPGEDPEYEAFGNGYGEVHSARAFRQLIERAARTFAPAEDRWPEDGRVIDPFRPTLRYPAASDREFDVLQERHLNTVRAALRRADTVLVALSASEVWESLADGAVYPHWARDAGRRFDPERHGVRTLTVEETVADLTAAAGALRALNPGVRIVLMISPEPQPASAAPLHVVAAATLGKAVLRIAAEAAQQAAGIDYFPALEIAGLDASWRTFAKGGAVPDAVLQAVANALLAVSEDGGVAFEGVAGSVPVLLPIAEPTPPVPDVRPEPAADASPAAPAKRKAKAKATVVDPFTIAKAAEERERAARAATAKGEARRQAAAQKKAAREEARAQNAEIQKAERAKALAEKKAALEAKLAERAERTTRLRTAAAEQSSRRKQRGATQPPVAEARAASAAKPARLAKRKAAAERPPTVPPTADERALRRQKIRSRRAQQTPATPSAPKGAARRVRLPETPVVPDQGTTEPSESVARAPKKPARPRRTPPAKR